MINISILDAEELTVIEGVTSGSINEDSANELTVSGTLLLMTQIPMTWAP